MNLKDILSTIQKSLRITPYKGSWYITERDMETILKIAYEAGKESVIRDVVESTTFDTKKRSKV